MNSRQGITGRDRDIDDFIKQERGNPNFQEMFKRILGGGSSTKKVDNFLREQDDFNLEPEVMQEIPGYFDPRTGKVIREDEILRSTGPYNPAGLPREDLISRSTGPYNPAGLPDDVYRATQRQYGKKSFGPYTSDDMRLIQQYFGGFKGV